MIFAGFSACKKDDSETNGIIFNTLIINDASANLSVSNATEEFSFEREITVSGKAKYIVALDQSGVHRVSTDRAPLAPGDNVFYVFETLDDEITNTFMITIRRRPMYAVSFDADGYSEVQTQQIEENSFATEPAAPSRTGYTFVRWNYDFAQAVTQDTEIQAVWAAKTDTKYKTEYYLQNFENDAYTLRETSNLQGTTDTKATAEIKNFAHFTHKASATDSGNIAPDGSLVLKVYYTRDKYNVTFESNGGTLENGEVNQILKYEGSAVAPVFTRTGYTFIGWDKTIPESVYEDITVTAQWKANRYTLTLNYGNGQPTEIIAKDCDSKLEIPNPERAGYDFIGWDKTIPDTMPAENLTRTAQWNAIFRLSENGDTITRLTDYGKKKYTEIAIPAEIDGVKITSIGSFAFSGCRGLTSVTIPDSVTTIGACAFRDCSGLTSVTIPDSVTSIRYSAFENCSGLTSVMIPDSVLSIGNSAFGGCSGLTSVTIGNSVTSIGEFAFEDCSGLISVVIPDSVTFINAFAFSGCSGLTGVYITDIEKWCKILFENDVANPLYYAHNLYLNNKLVTDFVIPDSITSIGAYAFIGCSGFTSVTIPDGVTSIGASAFSGCSGLASVYITDIEKWCKISFKNDVSNPLYYAHNLYLNNKLVTDFVIPDSITSISAYAFIGCSALKGVYITDLEKWCEFSFGDYSSNPLFYAHNLYLNNQLVTNLVIPESVTSIGAYTFTGCSGFTSVTIPDGVTSIKDYAFAYCSGITNITIPDGVTSIGYRAFYNCSGLTKIYYKGSESEWGTISIDFYNEKLKNATRYYYSAEKPTASGNYWHYNENGEIEEW
ncbi:MAG: leucine-rich repeat protein [Lachnospiraceae bacterium]